MGTLATYLAVEASKSVLEISNFSRFPKVCSKASEGFSFASPTALDLVRPTRDWGSTWYMSVGGASIRAPRTGELCCVTRPCHNLLQRLGTVPAVDR